MNTVTNRLDGGSLSPASSERELLNENGLNPKGKLSSSDKQTNLSLSDGSFDNNSLELEWSDNDIKVSIVSSESPSTPGFDQSEAFAGIILVMILTRKGAL